MFLHAKCVYLDFYLLFVQRLRECDHINLNLDFNYHQLSLAKLA